MIRDTRNDLHITNKGTVVCENRSYIEFVVSVILVGSVTSCCRNRPLVISISCEQSAGFVADGQTLLCVQLISAMLKSPPIHTCSPSGIRDKLASKVDR